MRNLSQIKRDRMKAFLEELKNGSDDEHLQAIDEIEIEQNRCAMACQGCGAVFYFF